MLKRAQAKILFCFSRQGFSVLVLGLKAGATPAQGAQAETKMEFKNSVSQLEKSWESLTSEINQEEDRISEGVLVRIFLCCKRYYDQHNSSKENI